jgi:hypothetical protein
MRDNRAIMRNRNPCLKVKIERDRKPVESRTSGNGDGNHTGYDSSYSSLSLSLSLIFDNERAWRDEEVTNLPPSIASAPRAGRNFSFDYNSKVGLNPRF